MYVKRHIETLNKMLQKTNAPIFPIQDCICDCTNAEIPFCVEITLSEDLEITKKTKPQIVFCTPLLQCETESCIIQKPKVKNPCPPPDFLDCKPIIVKKVMLTGCIPVYIGLANLRSKCQNTHESICIDEKIPVSVTFGFTCEDCNVNNITFVTLKRIDFAKCGRNKDGNQIVKIFGEFELLKV